jgi:hypothetical protein
LDKVVDVEEAGRSILDLSFNKSLHIFAAVEKKIAFPRQKKTGERGHEKRGHIILLPSHQREKRDRGNW